MPDLVAVTTTELRIAEIVEPELTRMGYDLVRVRIGGGRTTQLQIMAERKDGRMEIDDCAELSKTVSGLLDVENPIADTYRLEVSSPGIDRPLTRLGDFIAWKGHLAKIDLAEPIEGRRRFKGTIVDVRGSRIDVRSGHIDIAFDFESVANARLVITDDLLHATGPIRDQQETGEREQP